MSNPLSNDAINESSFSNYPADTNPENKGMGWLLPLFLLVLATALVLYFLKGSNTSSLPIAQQFMEAADTSTNKITLKTDSAIHESIEIELPNNSVINGSSEGIELHLVINRGNTQKEEKTQQETRSKISSKRKKRE